MAYSVPRPLNNINRNLNGRIGSKVNGPHYENLPGSGSQNKTYDTPRPYNKSHLLPKPQNEPQENVYDEVKYPSRVNPKPRALSAFAHPNIHSQLMTPSPQLLSTNTRCMGGSNTNLNKTNCQGFSNGMRGLNTKTNHRVSQTNLHQPQGSTAKKRKFRLFSVGNKENKVCSPKGKVSKFQNFLQFKHRVLKRPKLKTPFSK